MRLKRQPFLAVLALTVFFPLPAFGQGVEITSGLHISTFETPKGKIKIYLPDGMASGDTISGTVILEAGGETEGEKGRNRNDLNEYLVELEGEKKPLAQKNLKWTIPASLTGGATYLILKNKNGEELVRAVIPIRTVESGIERPTNPKQWEYECPRVGQGGNPIEIKGPFDGNFDTTNLKIGGKEVRLLAESPRRLVSESPADVVGSTEIELKEGGVTVKRRFNNLRVVKVKEGEIIPQYVVQKSITPKIEKEATEVKGSLAKETSLPFKQEGVKFEEIESILKEEKIQAPPYPKELTKEEVVKDVPPLSPQTLQTPAPAKGGEEGLKETKAKKEETPPLQATKDLVKIEIKEEKVKKEEESRKILAKKQTSTSPLAKEPIKEVLAEGTPAPARQKSRLVIIARVKKEETAPQNVSTVAPIEAKEEYTIQVGSFNKESEAKTLAGTLKSKGYLVFVRQAEVPGKGIWHRVRIGTFKTVKEAKLFGDGLIGREGEIQSFLITVNN